MRTGVARTACTCRNPGLLPASHSPFPHLGSWGSPNSLCREMNFDIFSYLGLEPPCEKILFFKTGHVSDLGMWPNRQNAAVSVIHQPLGVWTWSSVYGLKSEALATGMKVHCSVYRGKKKGKRGRKTGEKKEAFNISIARCCPLPPGALMAAHVDAALQGPLCPGCRTCMVVPFSFLWMESMDWQGSGVPHGCVQLCMKWKELSFLSICLKQLTKRNRK